MQETGEYAFIYQGQRRSLKEKGIFILMLLMNIKLEKDGPSLCAPTRTAYTLGKMSLLLLHDSSHYLGK